MTTPEGKIKAKIRTVLDRPGVWSFWPVPSGYQATTLDILGAVYVANKRQIIARFFAIEAKRPGKTETAAQGLERERMEAVGAKVFVINSDEGVKELDEWISSQLS